MNKINKSINLEMKWNFHTIKINLYEFFHVVANLKVSKMLVYIIHKNIAEEITNQE